MKLYIHNYNNRQIADFYSSPPLGEILWEGGSWQALLEDTGFAPQHIGGFHTSDNEIYFSQELQDTAINPIARLLSPIEKLNTLTAQVAQLTAEKQVALLSPSGMSGVYLALSAGNIDVAKGVIENIPVGEDEELIALKNDAITLLES